MNPSASLRALVLARRRRWLAARAVECALVGGGVAGVTLAAARLSGAPASSPALLAAGLCALLCAATLLRERWRDELQFTRRLDERVGAAGALFTACEGERRGAREPLLRLLAERTRAELDGARLARAAAPPSPLFAAALLGGLALWAWAAERPPLERPLASSATGAVQLGTLPGEQDGALGEPAASAGPGARQPEPQPAPGTAGDLPATPAVGTSTAAAGSPQGPEGSSGDPALAAGAAVRTMSRPPAGDPMDVSTPSTTPAASAAPGDSSERAASGPRGRFWARRHDGVVARFLAATPRD